MLMPVVAACGGAAASTSSPSKAPASKSSATASSTPAASASTSASTPKKLQKVHLRLPWLVGGYDEAYLLAKAKGYYKQAGFDVSILQGKGSATAVETVGNGSDTFGVADSGTAVQLISKGEPVKILAVLPAESPDSFVTKTPLTSPKGLLHRTIVTAAGDANLILLPAVLSRYGMKKSQLKIDFVSPAAIPQTMLKTPNSVMLGFRNSNDQTALRLNSKLIITPYAKFGVDPYGTGIITRLAELKNHPNAVRRFVAASIKGWQATIKDPAAAVAATSKAFPNASKWALQHALQATLTMLKDSSVKGKPLGWTTKAGWQATVNLLHKYAGMKTVKPLNDYYTNSFLPKS